MVKDPNETRDIFLLFQLTSYDMLVKYASHEFKEMFFPVVDFIDLYSTETCATIRSNKDVSVSNNTHKDFIKRNELGLQCFRALFC